MPTYLQHGETWEQARYRRFAEEAEEIYIFQLRRLCLIWNKATSPSTLRTEAGHKAAAKLSRKVMALIDRNPMRYRIREFGNGSISI